MDFLADEVEVSVISLDKALKDYTEENISDFVCLLFFGLLIFMLFVFHLIVYLSYS